MNEPNKLGGNLPNWKGASHIYNRLYSLLRHKGPDWVDIIRRKCYPNEEMVEIINALNRGDEEELKGLALQYLNQIEEAIACGN